MTVNDVKEGIVSGLASDGTADYIQLTEQLNMVSTVTETVLGLFVAIILIGVPLVVALEVAYINFPIMQAKLERVLLKTTGRVNKTLGLIFRDATSALRIANTVETGTSVNLIYFKIKFKAILIAILTVVLILGAGPDIVRILVAISKSIIEGFRRVI